MDLISVARILRCPCCLAPNPEISDAGVACSECEEVLPVDGYNVFVGSSDRSTDDWREKQKGSVSRYESADYYRDETVPLLFGGFMAPTLDRREVVLDIGCGIKPGLPAYVRELRLENYMGIEPLPNPLRREFPCLVGAIAESIPLNDASVDAVILASVYASIEEAVSDRVRRRVGWLEKLLTPALLIQLDLRLGVSPKDLRPIDAIDAWSGSGSTPG